MFAQRVRGNGEGEGAATPGDRATERTHANQGWGGGLGPGGHSEGPQEARGDRWAGQRHAHTSGQRGPDQVRPPQNQERQGLEEPGRARRVSGCRTAGGT